jgi:hypothetical protein
VKKTPEEKKQAAQRRAEERRARFKKFPQGGIGTPYAYISIHPEEDWASVSVRSDTNGEKWFQGEIPFDDAKELAEFIRALICRYNALVQDTNKAAKACPPMEKLNDLPLAP